MTLSRTGDFGEAEVPIYFAPTVTHAHIHSTSSTATSGASIDYKTVWISSGCNERNTTIYYRTSTHDPVQWYHTLGATSTSSAIDLWSRVAMETTASSVWGNYGSDDAAFWREWRSTGSQPNQGLSRPAILKRYRQEKAKEREGRKVLRRSMELFAQVRSAKELLTFLNGEPVIVRGRQYHYRIEKRDNLLQHSMFPDTAHIPYEFWAIDPVSGRRLAKGCVIIPNTPVIDQVLAVLMYLENPQDEAELLKKTNWSPRLPHEKVAVPIHLAA